ncbi:acyltransferase family protein [Pontibacter oryzae]|uniref:Acyltransferase n=1 Tax=Pontibacter oryzae TaxID=2304593 RepID=A0A399SER4_9BACT|nr:acyltransferase [Pontibacter oryzae]RIJ41651.1 acyltransferase [Pontibacter oryzae]
MKQHLQQIDVIKGLAIIMVLLLHSLTRKDLLDSYAIYHIWQAVPLFMIVMGLNLGLSVHAKSPQANELYTRIYFLKKATRILTPYFIVFLLCVPIGLAWEWIQEEEVLTFDSYTWVGVLPVTGRGNYFITLLLQSIVLLPIIGYAFSRKPIVTSVLLLAAELAYHVWATEFSFFDENNYLHDAAFPRYFTAIVYGLWLSRIVKLPLRQPYFLILAMLAVSSIAMLWFLAYGNLDLSAVFRPAWELQQVFTYGYAAFLVWLTIRVLPSSSGKVPLRLLAELGKASYHIFLVQVIYFGLAQQDYPLLTNVAICIIVGYSFFRAEKKWQL